MGAKIFKNVCILGHPTGGTLGQLYQSDNICHIAFFRYMTLQKQIAFKVLAKGALTLNLSHLEGLLRARNKKAR